MTASQLIEELKKLPPDMPVVLKRAECEFWDVTAVEVKTVYEDSQGYYSELPLP